MKYVLLQIFDEKLKSHLIQISTKISLLKPKIGKFFVLLQKVIIRKQFLNHHIIEKQILLFSQLSDI